MADYNRNRRDENWDRRDRNREYDEFGSFDQTNYNREDWERYRRQNIAGYDPYTGNDYGRQDEYGNYNTYNDDRYNRRDQRSSYDNRSQGDWDRQDNRYGSYNAGYSGNYDRGNYGRSEYNQSDYYGDSYGSSRDYGSNRGYTNRRVDYRDEEYRSRDRDRDRRNWDRRDDRGDNRSFWVRAADEVATWFGVDDRHDRDRDDGHRGPHSGKGPRGYSRSDERIREDLCDRLIDDPYVDASDINVRVNNGEVTLEGHADNKQMKRRVEDLAEKIHGVKNVENHLKVSQSSVTVGSSKVYTERSDDDRNDRKKGWF